jgi:hypothetical protein
MTRHPSPEMLKMIDNVCDQVGLYPDIHLSGHSHLYERFTRTIKGRQIPYIVAGMGGYPNLTGLKKGKKPQPPRAPQSGKDASGNPLRLETFNNLTFGFLRMTVTASELDVVFIGVDPGSDKSTPMDGFSLNLKTGSVTDTQNIPADVSLTQAASKTSQKKKSASQELNPGATNKSANRKTASKKVPKNAVAKKPSAKRAAKKRGAGT